MDFIESNKNTNNSNKKEDSKNSNNIIKQTNTVNNIKQSKDYKDLENLLFEEKNKNNILNDKIKKLEKDLYNEKESNKKLLKDKNNLNNQLMNANEKIMELQNIINMKERQINQLNIRNNSIDNGVNNFMPGDNIISILFESGNQKIKNYCGAYKDTEIFVKIEEKLYDEFPEFKDEETYFLVGGKKIKRFRTLRENGIKNRDIIQVHIYGEEF